MSIVPRSTNAFQTIVVKISSPGVAQQVTPFLVPEGHPVSVTAKVKNTENMFVAETKAKAETGDRKEFVPGQSRDYHITNTAQLWVNAENANDALEISIDSNTVGLVPA